ncbi:hypothetical protein C8R46DRAFT_1044855 [Mycena filopes]|nr:hypothetical protein C8R46DRAFT_1044855 [Mycena filopes]
MRTQWPKAQGKLHESVEENARNQRTQFQEILHQLADLQARAGSGSLDRRVPELTVPGLNALFRVPGKLAELRSTMDEMQVSVVPTAQLVSWHWDLDSTAADISTRPGIVDEDSAQLESEHSTEFGQLFPSSDADAGLGGISVAIEALDYSEPLWSALIEVLPMDDTPSSTSFADPTVFPLATGAGASSRPPAKPQRRARKSKISPIGYPSPRRSVRLAAAVAGTPRGLLLSSAERELGSGVVITQLVYNICIFILWISRKQNMGYFTAVFQKAAFDPHQRTPSTQPRRPLGSSGIGDFNGRPWTTVRQGSGVIRGYTSNVKSRQTGHRTGSVYYLDFESTGIVRGSHRRLEFGVENILRASPQKGWFAREGNKKDNIIGGDGYEQAFDVELDDLCGSSCSLWIVQNLSCSATTSIRGGSRSKSIWQACNVPPEHRKCCVMTSVFRLFKFPSHTVWPGNPRATSMATCSASIRAGPRVSVSSAGLSSAGDQMVPAPSAAPCVSARPTASFDRIVSLLQLGPPVCDAQTVPTGRSPTPRLRSQTGLHQRLASLARSPRSKCSAPLHDHTSFDRSDCSFDPLYTTPRRSPRLHGYLFPYWGLCRADQGGVGGGDLKQVMRACGQTNATRDLRSHRSELGELKLQLLRPSRCLLATLQSWHIEVRREACAGVHDCERTVGYVYHKNRLSSTTCRSPPSNRTHNILQTSPPSPAGLPSELPVSGMWSRECEEAGLHGVQQIVTTRLKGEPALATLFSHRDPRPPPPGYGPPIAPAVHDASHSTAEGRTSFAPDLTKERPVSTGWSIQEERNAYGSRCLDTRGAQQSRPRKHRYPICGFAGRPRHMASPSRSHRPLLVLPLLLPSTAMQRAEANPLVCGRPLTTSTGDIGGSSEQQNGFSVAGPRRARTTCWVQSAWGGDSREAKLIAGKSQFRGAHPVRDDVGVEIDQWDRLASHTEGLSCSGETLRSNDAENSWRRALEAGTAGKESSRRRRSDLALCNDRAKVVQSAHQIDLLRDPPRIKGRRVARKVLRTPERAGRPAQVIKFDIESNAGRKRLDNIFRVFKWPSSYLARTLSFSNITVQRRHGAWAKPRSRTGLASQSALNVGRTRTHEGGGEGRMMVLHKPQSAFPGTTISANYIILFISLPGEPSFLRRRSQDILDPKFKPSGLIRVALQPAAIFDSGRTQLRKCIATTGDKLPLTKRPQWLHDRRPDTLTADYPTAPQGIQVRGKAVDAYRSLFANHYGFCCDEWSTGSIVQTKFTEKLMATTYPAHLVDIEKWSALSPTVVENIRLPGPSALRHCMITLGPPVCEAQTVPTGPGRSPTPRLRSPGHALCATARPHIVRPDRLPTAARTPLCDAQTVPTGRSPTPRLRARPLDCPLRPLQTWCALVTASDGEASSLPPSSTLFNVATSSSRSPLAGHFWIQSMSALLPNFKLDMSGRKNCYPARTSAGQGYQKMVEPRKAPWGSATHDEARADMQPSYPTYRDDTASRASVPLDDASRIFNLNEDYDAFINGLEEDLYIDVDLGSNPTAAAAIEQQCSDPQIRGDIISLPCRLVDSLSTYIQGRPRGSLDRPERDLNALHPIHFVRRSARIHDIAAKKVALVANTLNAPHPSPASNKSVSSPASTKSALSRTSTKSALSSESTQSALSNASSSAGPSDQSSTARVPSASNTAGLSESTQSALSNASSSAGPSDQSSTARVPSASNTAGLSKGRKRPPKEDLAHPSSCTTSKRVDRQVTARVQFECFIFLGRRR